MVSGASGFVGRDLVRRLAAEGWQVRAAARDAAAVPRAAGVTAVAMGDLAREIDWRAVIGGASHVVHLAGIAHAASAIPEAVYRQVNATAVRALAKAARDAGVARVVLMSSVRAQSGPSAMELVSEATPAAPTDAYGRSKLEAERGLADVLAGAATDWAVLRPVVIYGPGVKGNMRTLMRLARSPLPLPLGRLTGRRSLLGLANLAGAVAHGLESPAVSRRVLLVADPGPLAVPEIVGVLRGGLGRATRLVSMPLAPVRTALRLMGRAAIWERVACELVVDTRALQDTGWRPVETAAEGLARWVREESAAEQQTERTG